MRLNSFFAAIVFCIANCAFAQPYYDWMDEYTVNPANTIGRWNFDMVGATYAYDLVTGHTHQINLSGAVSFAAGTFANGLKNVGGTGTSTTNYGSMANSTGVFPSGSDPNLTIEFWLKLGDISQAQQYIIDKAGTDKNGYVIALDRKALDGSQYQLYFQVGNGTTAVVVAADLVWQTGISYHIAACWDGAADTGTLYRNGIEVGRVSSPGMAITNNSRSVRIANRLESTYWALNGTIDDLRISSVVYEFARRPVFYDWTSSYSSTARTLGLWQFEPGQIVGTSAYDVIAGATRSAISYGAVTFSSDAKFGNGLSNIGGSSSADYAGVASSDTLFPTRKDPSLTVECWVELNSIAQGTQYLIDKAYTDNSAYKLYLSRPTGVDANSYRLYFVVGNGTSSVSVWAKLEWQTDRFYHVAGVWDAVDDIAYLYCNGVEVARVTSPGMSIVNNSRTVYFANRRSSTYSALDGTLDEIRISDIAYKFAVAGCGQEGTEYLQGDISGPDGVSDCHVNLWDFALLASQWLNEIQFADGNQNIEVFFTAPPETAQNYDPNKIYPLGRQMLFSVYSVSSPDIEQCKPSGHTAIGPFYGTVDGQSSQLVLARANGLKMPYRVGIVNHTDDPCYPDWEVPSDAEITATVTAQVNAVKNNPDICMWILVSEELRYWYPEEMRLLQTTYNAIRAADPTRPIWMYEPNHRKAASLQQTLMYQDICGKGTYVYLVGMQENRIWVKWSIEQETTAIANVKPQAIPIMIADMYTDPLEQYIPLIRDWNRHDLYLSLISGVKGILIWSGSRSRDNFKYTFDDFFEGYSSVARELNGELKLGEVFLFGQHKNDISVTVTSGPSTLSLSYQDDQKTYSSVNFANIAYGRGRYLFLVNSANVPVSVSVSGLPAAKILKRDVFNNGVFEELIGGTFNLNFAPLEVKCFRIIPLPLACGQEGSEFMYADLSDPYDCKVAASDFALLANDWFECSDPSNSACE